MTKYALIAACLVALTGCQSGGSRESASGTSSSGVSGSGATYGQDPSSASQSDVSSPQESTFPESNVSAIPGTTSETDSSSDTPDATASSRPPDIDSSLGSSPTGIPGAINPSDASTSITSSEAGTATMNAADRAISQSVTDSLTGAGIPSQTLAKLQVKAMNGRVILSGKVGNLADKQRIEEQARKTPGVRSVISQLQVAGASGADNSAVGGVGSATTDTGAGAGASAPEIKPADPESGNTDKDPSAESESNETPR